MNAHVITDKEKILTVVAVAIVFFLGALDQTIVSTAMPRIVEQMKGIELFAWVTTIYLLTSTVPLPIYGKMSDIYGRKKILLISIVVFIFGSALCGLAGEMEHMPLIGGGMMQLIVFRGIQGLGGAGLFSTAASIIVDMFSPRERGKYMGMFVAMFGVASAIGPVIGGFLTDHGTISFAGHTVEGWRWVFYVNVPVAMFSAFMIIFKMPKLVHKGVGKVDYVGTILFVLGIVPLLLALTWGGSAYAWGSSTILGLFAMAAVFTVLFVIVEARVTDPMLPLSLFKNKVFSISNFSGFVIGVAFLGIIVFLPLFTQIVQGQNATNSGLTMLPFVVGMVISTTAAGRLCSRLGFYKSFIVGGLICILAGTFWMWQMDVTTRPLDMALRLFIAGFGLGPAQSLYNVAVANAVPISQIGISTSAGQFFRQMGQVVGLALFGTVLTHNLSTELPKHVPQIPEMALSQHLDLNEAQSQAMDPHKIQNEVNKVIEAHFARVAQAYEGDDKVQADVLKDELVPAPVKDIVRDRPTADAGSEPPLATAKHLMDEQATIVAADIESGIKATFSVSITRLIGLGFWILLGAFVATIFLPVVPLRNVSPAQERAKQAAQEAAAIAH